MLILFFFSINIIVQLKNQKKKKKAFTIITKHFILDVAEAPDPPLNLAEVAVKKFDLHPNTALQDTGIKFLIAIFGNQAR